MTASMVVRPHAGGTWASRLPLAVVALAFASIQLYLARLNSEQAILAALIIALGVMTLIGGYLLFLRRASVTVSETDVIVNDWLGRRRLHAQRTQVNMRLISVRDMGIADDFAVLWAKVPTGEVTAVLLRRTAWGDQALSSLRSNLHGRDGELNFRLTSKRALTEEFPRVHTQNLPAIAVVVVVVLLFAIVLSRN